jgi:hypothetical protein
MHRQVKGNQAGASHGSAVYMVYGQIQASYGGPGFTQPGRR